MNIYHLNLTYTLIFISLLNNCIQKAPCILILRDYDGYIFGSYCSDYFEVKRKFYGNGETFLFTFKVN